MVEEEGAAVGEADVLVCGGFGFGGGEWEGEDFVVVLGVAAFGHDFFSLKNRSTHKGPRPQHVVTCPPI